MEWVRRGSRGSSKQSGGGPEDVHRGSIMSGSQWSPSFVNAGTSASSASASSSKSDGVIGDRSSSLRWSAAA
eukprot:456998-Pyramimonas_sp.AAC.1